MIKETFLSKKVAKKLKECYNKLKFPIRKGITKRFKGVMQGKEENHE
jgi:hypothetical protein